MSTDRGFSSMTFPRLQAARQDGLDEQSRARGHAAGYAEGLRAAATRVAERAAEVEAEHAAVLRHLEAKTDRAVRLLGSAAHALDSRTLPLLRDAEQVLVATALDLAEAVLGSELSRTEVSARRALERALALRGAAEGGEIHTIRMHPDDLAVLDVAALAGTGARFTADASLARGDALTEFPDGFLDARIGTAFTRAKAALLGEHS